MLRTIVGFTDSGVAETDLKRCMWPSAHGKHSALATATFFSGFVSRSDPVDGRMERYLVSITVIGSDLRVDTKLPKTEPLSPDMFLLETVTLGAFAVRGVSYCSSKRVAAVASEGSAAVGMMCTYQETL